MNSIEWDDIENILFDGTVRDIQKLKCPDCGGIICYEYNNEFKTLIIKCVGCGLLSKSIKLLNIPNCVNFFGDNYCIQSVD